MKRPPKKFLEDTSSEMAKRERRFLRYAVQQRAAAHKATPPPGIFFPDIDEGRAVEGNLDSCSQVGKEHAPLQGSPETSMASPGSMDTDSCKLSRGTTKWKNYNLIPLTIK